MDVVDRLRYAEFVGFALRDFLQIFMDQGITADINPHPDAGGRSVLIPHAGHNGSDRGLDQYAPDVRSPRTYGSPDRIDGYALDRW